MSISIVHVSRSSKLVIELSVFHTCGRTGLLPCEVRTVMMLLFTWFSIVALLPKVFNLARPTDKRLVPARHRPVLILFSQSKLDSVLLGELCAGFLASSRPTRGLGLGDLVAPSHCLFNKRCHAWPVRRANPLSSSFGNMSVRFSQFWGGGVDHLKWQICTATLLLKKARQPSLELAALRGIPHF